jgi:hypothetical protein
MKHLSRGFAAALVVLAFGPLTVVGGAPVEQTLIRLDNTFPDASFCGVRVAVHQLGHIVEFRYEDESRKMTARQTTTFTNAAGDWLTLDSEGLFREVVTVEGSIITVIQEMTGVQPRVRSSDGVTAAFDRGRVVTTLTGDLEVGQIISFDLVVAGPHPYLDEPSLLCDVVREVLA